METWGQGRLNTGPGFWSVLCCWITGDMATFDNTRVLHGRKNYVSKPDVFRLLEGAYLDWAEVMSRLRILQKSVQSNAWSPETARLKWVMLMLCDRNT